MFKYHNHFFSLPLTTILCFYFVYVVLVAMTWILVNVSKHLLPVLDTSVATFKPRILICGLYINCIILISEFWSVITSSQWYKIHTKCKQISKEVEQYSYNLMFIIFPSWIYLLQLKFVFSQDCRLHIY